MNAANLPLGEALRSMLADVTGVSMSFAINDGYVKVLPSSDCLPHLTLRIYDVRPLTAHEGPDELRDLILLLSSTGSWLETGDGDGSIKEFRGRLLITQTLETHIRLTLILTEAFSWMLARRANRLARNLCFARRTLSHPSRG